MKGLLEIICFPITAVVWLLSFLFISLFFFDMFKKVKNGDKNLLDVFIDVNIVVHRTYLVDYYFSMSVYARTVISLILYYTLFF